MSHDATNWAIKQRGLKPAAKVVLWHLCDRYHPDHGCFPSKETLADDCEMSERSVYDQIVSLVEAGLLVVAKTGGKTASGKFTSNEYILGCDPRFTQYADEPQAKSAVGRISQEPSANSRENRRQNLPSNSVREPVREPVIGFSDFWEAWPNKTAKAQAEKAWKKLKPDDRRQAALSAAPWFDAWRKKHPDASPIYPATYLNGRRWEDSAPTQSHETVHQQQADAIRACSPVARAFRPATITDLLARGYVTTDECRKAGVL